MENIFLTVLIVLVAAGSVFAATFFVVKEFFANEEKKRGAEIKAGNQTIVIPARLQAYERVILLLERIAPQSLIMRTHKNGMSARLLQSELVRSIRNEYEHNISQQLYLSANSWEYVKSAKEETIKIINIAATKIPESGNGLDLSQKIFEIGAQLKKLPTDIAIEQVRKEFSQQF